MRAEIPAEQRERAAQPLPGIRPVGQADWITVDANYADQIAERDRLIQHRLNDVYSVLPEAKPAAQELLEEVLLLLHARDDFDVQGTTVACPDGRHVDCAERPPLVSLSRILQEDLCIHLKQGDAHHLMGAVLCFPSFWTLAEKIGKPLLRIHDPVPEYDADIGKRVQRLFDGVQVGRPIWRANYMRKAEPALFAPKSEADTRVVSVPDGPYERSERQTLFRLPRSQAVVFAIHTIVTPAAAGGG